VLVVAVHFVGQMVLVDEFGDGEGRMDCGRCEIAPWFPKKPEAEAAGTLGAEGGFHLDPMP